MLSPNAMESLHRLAVGLKRADIDAYLMETINAKENLDETLSFSLTIELWKDMRRMKQMNGISMAT